MKEGCYVKQLKPSVKTFSSPLFVEFCRRLIYGKQHRVLSCQRESIKKIRSQIKKKKQNPSLCFDLV